MLAAAAVASARSGAPALAAAAAAATCARLAAQSFSSAASGAAPRHLLTIADLSKAEILAITDAAVELKANVGNEAHRWHNALANKTLLMFFSKPSLRTRLSFETGMTQLGGHAIFYHLQGQNLGVKESFYDTAVVSSSMVDAIMARVASRDEVRALAADSSVPVINALDDWAHPCQMLGDVLTIKERRPLDKRLKLAYVGDVANNVTYDLMRTCAILGWDVAVAGPDADGFRPDTDALAEARALATAGTDVEAGHDARAAIEGADIVYADSWMSYGISADAKEHRLAALEPFRVTSDLMAAAHPEALFMHCLPALRGMEVTADVIDGPQSVVFPQAENRMHGQKALLLFLLGKL